MTRELDDVARELRASCPYSASCDELRAEVERLRAENERLVSQLNKFALEPKP